MASAYGKNDKLRCTSCDGTFRLVDLSKDYDPTYCPYCGTEDLQLDEVGVLMSFTISVELEKRLRDWAKSEGLDERNMGCTKIVEEMLTKVGF